ncbi:DUF5947 family protein [Methylocapsa polymorpha]|uniref:DUF5947 family protein n=1 Tax=Methylocapsa polymorpha TaxID=3080828 RepID=A0ABZ0HW09_9HYPH|nr:DUF5947 family protein [Methylocapsa sp. RX1]
MMHQHLIEVAKRRILCACDQCVSVLGMSERFRTILPRTDVLLDFRLSAAEWDALQIPIDMVFLFHSTVGERSVAVYPGPAGPMESALSLDAWSHLVAANPVLGEMTPDIEALLVNRTKGAHEYYRVSIDRCYALVGLIRTHWQGLSGGAEAWEAINSFFVALRAAANEPVGGCIHG